MLSRPAAPPRRSSATSNPSSSQLRDVTRLDSPFFTDEELDFNLPVRDPIREELHLADETTRHFPSPHSVDMIVYNTLAGLTASKREKTLLTDAMCLAVVEALCDTNGKGKPKSRPTAFYKWASSHYGVDFSSGEPVLTEDGRPLTSREMIEETLRHAHGKAGHGGRDKTMNKLKGISTGIPKEIVAKYVGACPACQKKTIRAPPKLLDSQVNMRVLQASSLNFNAKNMEKVPIGIEEALSFAKANYNFKPRVTAKPIRVGRDHRASNSNLLPDNMVDYTGSQDDQPTDFDQSPLSPLIPNYYSAPNHTNTDQRPHLHHTSSAPDHPIYEPYQTTLSPYSIPQMVDSNPSQTLDDHLHHPIPTPSDYVYQESAASYPTQPYTPLIPYYGDLPSFASDDQITSNLGEIHAAHMINEGRRRASAPDIYFCPTPTVAPSSHHLQPPTMPYFSTISDGSLSACNTPLMRHTVITHSIRPERPSSRQSCVSQDSFLSAPVSEDAQMMSRTPSCGVGVEQQTLSPRFDDWVSPGMMDLVPMSPMMSNGPGMDEMLAEWRTEFGGLLDENGNFIANPSLATPGFGGDSSGPRFEASRM